MSTPIMRGWQPQRTWVAVVGTIEFKHEDVYGSFPQEKRRDAALVRFFQDTAVPADHIIYLRDSQATLGAINSKLAAHFAQSAPGDMLFFYYAGHGYLLDAGDACLACYDAGDDGLPDWRADSVPALIERNFHGDRAIIAIDCCYSGCMADIVQKRKGAVSYACLTSSSASESSTGNWTFTEALIAGLRGDAFTDEDDSHTITLQELAEQMEGDMAFAEEQMASFVTTGRFDPKMIIAPAKSKPGPDVGRRVEAYSSDDWYKARIVDQKGEQRKVHYYGYDDSDDEWLKPDLIRDATPVQYRVGTKVEVRWKRKWYPATILAVRGGVHYIGYDGEGAEWNEWVASKRIRLPQD